MLAETTSLKVAHKKMKKKLNNYADGAHEQLTLLNFSHHQSINKSIGHSKFSPQDSMDNKAHKKPTDNK